MHRAIGGFQQVDARQEPIDAHLEFHTRTAVETPVKPQKLPRSQTIVKTKVFGQKADSTARLAIAERRAQHPTLSPIGSDQAEEHLDRRRLARAVGAQKPEDLTGAHRQREVRHGQRRAEPLAESPRVDHEVGHFSDSAIFNMSTVESAPFHTEHLSVARPEIAVRNGASTLGRITPHSLDGHGGIPVNRDLFEGRRGRRYRQEQRRMPVDRLREIACLDWRQAEDAQSDLAERWQIDSIRQHHFRRLCLEELDNGSVAALVSHDDDGRNAHINDLPIQSPLRHLEVIDG